MKLNELLEVLDDINIVIIKDDGDFFTTIETKKSNINIDFPKYKVVYVRQDYEKEQVIIKIKGE